MAAINPGRPSPDEHISYFGQYIDLVPDGHIVDLLAHQLNVTYTRLAPLTPNQAAFRPKLDDWNMIEVVGHLADTERVLIGRALHIARNDHTPLPSANFEQFVANANFASRPLASLLDEFSTVRHATVAFLRTLDAAVWQRRGIAANNPISVRARAYIVAGHELHHLADFRQRYQI